jgi:hypothetical protein
MILRKKVNALLPVIIAVGFASNSLAQEYEPAKDVQEKPSFEWPESKKMGLSLTFDDAIKGEFEVN